MGRTIMQLPETSWVEFKKLFSAFFSAALGNTVSFDGVVPGDLSAIKHYGECSTSAAIAGKTVACSGFTLITGAIINVKFTTTNTASNPTLNVNSTGAKPIYYHGTAISAGILVANRIYTFIYNGTRYELVGDITPDVIPIINGGTGQTDLSAVTVGKANSATKATQDATGKVIADTYETKANAIVGVSVDKQKLTFTKGDGSTVTLQTQDTDTNTHWITKLIVGASNSTVNASTTNGNTYIRLFDDATARESHKISGSGATTVTSDSSGNIVVNSTDTTYAVASQSANGLMSAADKKTLDGVSNIYLTKTDAGNAYLSKSEKAASATTSDKLGTSSVGDSTRPIYLNAGTATSVSSALKSCYAVVESEAVTNNIFRIANGVMSGAYNALNIVILIQNIVGVGAAIWRISLNAGSTNGVFSSGTSTLVDNVGLSPEKFIVAYKSNSGVNLQYELYAKIDARYSGYRFTVLQECSRSGQNLGNQLTLTNHLTTTGTSTITSGFTALTTTNAIITTNISGNASSATKATSATTADSATNVTGTVAIVNGGTGASTVANARKNLFASNLGSTATYLLGITKSWADGGYIALADAKTLLGIKTIQQGTITIYNKFVVSGCVISKVSNSRNIILSENGTSSSTGASKFYADGAVHNLTDGLTAAVPTNSTTSVVTYYACLVKNNSGVYELKVQTSIVGVLALYKIVVPANNTVANLNSVTISDVRRIETNYTNFYASRSYASVALSTALSNTNYSIELRAESWSGANVGELLAYDLANNGFKIEATGDADNILVRWCATSQ